jgi:hypothetical protein
MDHCSQETYKYSQFENLKVYETSWDGKITSNWILRKVGVKMWVGLYGS